MTANPARAGFHTITPYLMVPDAEGLLAFVQQVFGAEECFRAIGSAGGYHIEVRVGDSMLMIGGGRAWQGAPVTAALYLYLDEVDAVYQKALAAGASALDAPADHSDGDRRAGVRDPFGNVWYIARHNGAGSG